MYVCYEIANFDTCGRVGSHTRLLCKLLVRMSRFSVPCKLLVRMYWASRCGQPPAASLQAVGPYVLGLAGLCGQPPAALLQVVGPHVRVQLAVCSCMSTRLGRAALNLHGCNYFGTLCRCVGHACVVGWWGGLRCLAAPEYASQGFQRRIGLAILRPLRLYAGSPQCAALVQGEE